MSRGRLLVLEVGSHPAIQGDNGYMALWRLLGMPARHVQLISLAEKRIVGPGEIAPDAAEVIRRQADRLKVSKIIIRKDHPAVSDLDRDQLVLVG